MASLVDKQCVAIAWIALLWNEIEANVDMVLCHCLEVPEFARTDLVTRINGFDGKVELIKLRVRHDLGERHGLLKLFELTLGGAKEIKKHRDAVVHTYPDFDAGIGRTMGRRGKVLTVNIALNTLSLIQEHSNALCAEATTLNEIMALAIRHQIEVNAGDATGKVSQRSDFQALIAQLQSEQKTRRELPRLPPVPR